MIFGIRSENFIHIFQRNLDYKKVCWNNFLKTVNVLPLAEFQYP